MVKASYDETLIKCGFDVLVVDEVSMASLPQLYCAAALISERIVLCGDHLQLQPISISSAKEAEKWMKNSYFSFVEGDNEAYKKENKLTRLDPYLAKLSTQYRMPKQISSIVRPWYKQAGNDLKDGDLPDTMDLDLGNHLIKTGTLFFLDTSNIESYHSKASDGSPYNLINAAIVAELVRELIEDYKIHSTKIYCITPYRAQFQLTLAILRKFLEKPSEVRKEIASSVHRIQGGEAPIVIYDLTDGRQNKFTGFIKSNDIHIHNVAITRSKAKLIFVGDISKLKRLKELDPEPSLCTILDNILANAQIIDAKPFKEKVFINYTTEDLLNQSAINLNDAQKNKIVVLTSGLYYKTLIKDIQQTKHSIFMVSPFITRNGWERLRNSIIHFLKNSNGTMQIITKPPNQMFEKNKLNMAAVEILNEFIELGIRVTTSPKIHAKLIVLDRETDEAISYWGSLNPLSFKNTEEINTRLQGREMAELLIAMSLVGNLKSYKELPLEKSQIFEDTIIAVRRELNDLRWRLAGLYRRPIGAICRNSTIESIIKLVPSTRQEYLLIQEFNRDKCLLWKHIDEIDEIISPLQKYKSESEKFVQRDLFSSKEPRLN